MEIAEYKNIFNYESSHFLYTSRHNLVLNLVKKYLPRKKNLKLKILDAGCGTGLLAKKLNIFGQVWGIDIHPEALRFAKKRGINIKKASVANIPFQNSTFNCVISVDVIYHKAVSNDLDAIKEFYRVLKPEGILILRVPANKWLHLSHDKYVHTKKRYWKKEIEKKLCQAGFSIEKISYTNMFLFPFAAIQNIWETIFPPKHTKSGVSSISQPLSNLLTKVLNMEAFITTRVDLPFGIGIIAVARKPQATK